MNSIMALIACELNDISFIVIIHMFTTCRHNVEYECVVLISGRLHEEEQRLVLRGRASYDQRHERLVNVTTDT